MNLRLFVSNISSFTRLKFNFLYSFKSSFTCFKWIFIYSFKINPYFLVQMNLRLLDTTTVFATVPSDVSVCWEYCSTQTNTHNIILRLKFYSTLTLLKIHILLSAFPCYKYCQNDMLLIFSHYLYTNGYSLRCLTRQGCKCLTKNR